MDTKDGTLSPESTLHDEARRRNGVVVDRRVAAPPEFDGDQIGQIREGLAAGLDVSAYAKPEFDWRQMEKIRRRAPVPGV